MPVNLRTLRCNRNLVEELKRSCSERRRKKNGQYENGDNDEHENSSNHVSINNACPVDHVLHLEEELRESLKRLSAYRTQVNRQKAIQQKSNHKMEQKALQDAHQHAETKLKIALDQLPNFVDDQVHHAVLLLSKKEEHKQNGTHHHATTKREEEGRDSSNSRSEKSDNTAIVQIDPLFCLGGYEPICSTATKHATAAVVLTDIGLDFLFALDQLAFSEIQKIQLPTTISATKIIRIEVPSCMPLPLQEYQSMWGISSSSDARGELSTGNNNKNSDRTAFGAADSLLPLINAPSWMSILLHRHAKRTYMDRELPICNILQSSCTDVPNGKHHDAREEVRLKSWDGSKRNNKEVPWFRRLACGAHRQIELLILTGPSLLADSRPMQLEVIDRMKQFYQQLLVSKNRADRDISNLCIRAVPANELLLAESSRVVLEGTLVRGSNVAAGIQGEIIGTVCLGYVSNFQDYCSKNIRHGNTKESVHVLHGCFCSLPETLEWLLQLSTGQDCVELPPALLSIPNCRPSQQLLPFSSHHQQRLHYRRKIVASKKGGKKRVEQLPAHQPRGGQHGNIRNTGSKGIDCNGHLQHCLDGRQKALLEGAQPTPDEIQLEALSSPFGFLPFFKGAEK